MSDARIRIMPAAAAARGQSRSLLTVCRQRLEIPKMEDARDHSARFAARESPRKIKEAAGRWLAMRGGAVEELRFEIQALEERSEFDLQACALLLRRCALHKSLEEGVRLHEYAARSGELRNTFLANLVVLMYGSCGEIPRALAAFQSIASLNAHSWNIMIAAYAQNGHLRSALDLFWRMDPAIPRCSVSYCGALGVIAKLGAVADGRRIHDSLRGTLFESFGGAGSVGVALVNMYGKCACPDEARLVFDKLFPRSVVCWNAMISAYAQNQRHAQAIDIARRMDQEGVGFTPITLVGMIDACAKAAPSRSRDAAGEQARDRAAARGLLPGDVIVASALVNMYGKWGRIEDARRVFDSMSARNCFTWSGMIAAYAQSGQGERALDLFRAMDVAPNEVTFISVLDACAQLRDARTGRIVHGMAAARRRRVGGDRDPAQEPREESVTLGNALLNMYAKCGHWEEARRVFEAMPRRSAISWTSMLAAYARNGRPRDAIALFRRMEAEAPADPRAHPVTIISALDACADAGALRDGRRIHASLLARGICPDAALGNALVNMYAKCGSAGEAWAVFREIKNRSVVTWTTLLAAYSENADGSLDAVVEIHRWMCLDGAQPDDVTFVSLLAACSHAGKLERGREVFLAMVADFHTAPAAEHYRCMVDLLSRTGRLSDADELIRSLPGTEGDFVCWAALLNGCRFHHSQEHAKRAADHLLVAGDAPPPSDSSGAYVLLSQSLCPPRRDA